MTFNRSLDCLSAFSIGTTWLSSIFYSLVGILLAALSQRSPLRLREGYKPSKRPSSKTWIGSHDRLGMNVKTRLRLLPLLSMLLFSLTGCWNDDGEESPYPKANEVHTAYNFVRDVLQKYTDVLVFTYQTNRYLMDDDTLRRNSLRATDFSHATLFTADTYTLTTQDEGLRAHYVVKMTPIGGARTLSRINDTWRVDAECTEQGQTLCLSMLVTHAGDERWAVLDSECRPKRAEQGSCENRNGTWSVVWHDVADMPLVCRLSGSGTFTNATRDRLQIDYISQSPIEAVALPAPNEQKGRHLSDLLRNRATYGTHFTCWKNARLDIALSRKPHAQADHATAELYSDGQAQTVRIAIDNVVQTWDDTW